MSAIFISALIVLAGLAAYFYPWLWRQQVMTRIARQVREKGILALTYDDGPSATLTPRLLDLLQKYNVKATFFMLGRNARQHPEIVDRVLQEGHEIGCHSDQHLNAWKTAPWNAVTDINKGYAALSHWLPTNGKFRPPHGKMTLPTYVSVRRRGAGVWWWTFNSGDTHKVLPTPKTLGAAVSSARGGIVLMHDRHEHDRVQERDDFVIETTTTLLDLAKRESLVVAPLRQLCP